MEFLILFFYLSKLTILFCLNFDHAVAGTPGGAPGMLFSIAFSLSFVLHSLSCLRPKVPGIQR
jgi:hypothetical protein